MIIVQTVAMLLLGISVTIAIGTILVATKFDEVKRHYEEEYE